MGLLLELIVRSSQVDLDVDLFLHLWELLQHTLKDFFVQLQSEQFSPCSESILPVLVVNDIVLAYHVANTEVTIRGDIDN